MKVLLLALLLPISCAAQHKDIPTCQAHPEYCEKKAEPLTSTEKTKLEAALKATKDAERRAQELKDTERELEATIIRAHNFSKFPAPIPSKGVFFQGGTCTGTFDFVDGILIYTPASDIYSCTSEGKR